MTFSYQLGQVIPGTLLSLGLLSVLGVTASPAVTEFIEQAEITTLQYSHSELKSSLKINSLLATLNPSNDMVINGHKVILKYGYPIAKKQELEKLVNFGNLTLVDDISNTVTIWSAYGSYCYHYSEVEVSNSSPTLSAIGVGKDGKCSF